MDDDLPGECKEVVFSELLWDQTLGFLYRLLTGRVTDCCLWTQIIRTLIPCIWGERGFLHCWPRERCVASVARTGRCPPPPLLSRQGGAAGHAGPTALTTADSPPALLLLQTLLTVPLCVQSVGRCDGGERRGDAELLLDMRHALSPVYHRLVSLLSRLPDLLGDGRLIEGGAEPRCWFLTGVEHSLSWSSQWQNIPRDEVTGSVAWYGDCSASSLYSHRSPGLSRLRRCRPPCRRRAQWRCSRPHQRRYPGFLSDRRIGGAPDSKSPDSVLLALPPNPSLLMPVSWLLSPIVSPWLLSPGSCLLPPLPPPKARELSLEGVTMEWSRLCFGQHVNFIQVVGLLCTVIVLYDVCDHVNT